MKKRWIFIGFVFWLAGAFFVTLSGSDRSYAGVNSTETQQEIDEANQKIKELEEEKQGLEEGIDELEELRDDLAGYVTKLDSQVTTLNGKIKKNESSIQKLTHEIDDLEQKIIEVTEQLEKQYESMKTRIKYIYESNDTGYMELLIGSTSLSELFNRVEYITKIQQYDQKLLSNYKQTKDDLEQNQKVKQNKKDTLETTKESLEFEKEAVEKLSSQKQKELKKRKIEIEHAETEIDEYDEEIAAQTEAVEKLLEEQRRQIAQEEAAKKQGDDSSSPSSNKVSTSGFIWPLSVSGRISCGFGPRRAPTAGASTYHKGIDIAVPTGTTVRAAKAGKVVISTYSSSCGNYVGIYHGDGVYTYYMHNSSLSVSVGDQVSQGQKIASSGSTGISTGPHLHFAVYAGGSYVNPLSYVSQ